MSEHCDTAWPGQQDDNEGFQDCAAVVLCGGLSTRMGVAKATLLIGDETMLGRIVRVLGEIVAIVVVVAAEGQELPELDRRVTITRDRRLAAGPLEGIRAGLSALPAGIRHAFVTGCDLPLLCPELIKHLLRLRKDYHVVVPVEADVQHPLLAVYHRDIADRADSLLRQGERRPRALFDSVKTRQVNVETLRVADPDLLSFRNTNTPEAYREVLDLAGFTT